MSKITFPENKTAKKVCLCQKEAKIKKTTELADTKKLYFSYLSFK